MVLVGAAVGATVGATVGAWVAPGASGGGGGERMVLVGAAVGATVGATVGAWVAPGASGGGGGERMVLVGAAVGATVGAEVAPGRCGGGLHGGGGESSRVPVMCAMTSMVFSSSTWAVITHVMPTVESASVGVQVCLTSLHWPDSASSHSPSATPWRCVSEVLALASLASKTPAVLLRPPGAGFPQQLTATLRT